VKKMPRTINNSPEMQKRIPVRLPSTMMSEVDRLVRKHSELNYNRQQFIESAVREKIERLIMLQSAKTNNTIVQVENLPKIMQ
jgi:metal-responsive CopG/Arc/MetJ family transcriptional regulator